MGSKNYNDNRKGISIARRRQHKQQPFTCNCPVYKLPVYYKDIKFPRYRSQVKVSAGSFISAKAGAVILNAKFLLDSKAFLQDGIKQKPSGRNSSNRSFFKGAYLGLLIGINEVMKI